LMVGRELQSIRPLGANSLNFNGRWIIMKA
jgi:hypothetical protein